MKFENIKVDDKIQNKETGKVYTVIGCGFAPILDSKYECNDGSKVWSILNQEDADLFRKYKGD